MRLSHLSMAMLVGCCVSGAFGTAHASGSCPDIPAGVDQRYRAWFIDKETGREIADGETLPTYTRVLWHGRAEAYGHCDVHVYAPDQGRCVFSSRQERTVSKIARGFYLPTGNFQPFHDTFGRNPDGSTATWHVLDTTDSATSSGPREEWLGYEGPYRFFSSSIMLPTACNIQPTRIDAPVFTLYARKPKKPCRTGSEGALFGNPCDALNGTKTQTETDFEVGSFRFSRYYNSDLSHLDIGQGLGWSHSFSRRLERGGMKLNIVEADGRSETFTLSNGVWAGDADTKLSVAEADGQYIVRFRSGRIERFDARGKLLTSTDLLGRSTSYTYDASNRLVRIQEAFGRQLDIAYSGLRISSISSAGSVLATYAYGANGTLLSVTHADGTTRSYAYDIRHVDQHLRSALLTGITDESGTPYAAWTYGTDGRVATSGTAEQYRFSYSGNDFSGVNTVLDPQGVTWSLTYGTAAGSKVLRSKTRSSDNSSYSQAYDGYANRTELIDQNGVRSCSSYDTARQLETHRADNVPASVTTSCGYLARYASPLPSGARRTVTAWHPDWDLVVKVAEPGKITTNIYNGQPDPFNGNAIASCAPATARLPDGRPIAALCKRVEQATTDANGVAGFNAALQPGAPASEQQWTYDDRGSTTSVVERSSGVESGRWMLAYSATGDVATITDVTAGNLVGQATQYDAHGRLLAGTSVDGIALTRSYTPRGQLRQRNDGAFTTTFDYNPIGLRTLATFSQGGTTQFVYDATHRLSEIRVNGVSVGAPGAPFTEPIAWKDLRDLGAWQPWLAQLGRRASRLDWLPMSPAHAQVPPPRVLPGPILPPPPTNPVDDLAPGLGGDRAQPGNLVWAVQGGLTKARIKAREILDECVCKGKDERYPKPTYTNESFEHVWREGHHWSISAPTIPGKSKFGAGIGGQAFTDDVVAKAGTPTPGTGSSLVYRVPDMGYVTGTDAKGRPTRAATVIVQGPCPYKWSERWENEVITQFPGLL